MLEGGADDLAHYDKLLEATKGAEQFRPAFRQVRSFPSKTWTT